MSASGEIVVVPRNGQGHLFPCMELCKHLILRNFQISLVIDGHITSSIPSSLLHSHLFQVCNVSPSNIESLLAGRSPDSCRPVCAIIDHIMNRTQEVFWKFNIPTVIFITSGACWAAVQHAAYVVQPQDMKPGEVRALPGLPKEMVLNYSDLKQRRHMMPNIPAAIKMNPKMPRGPPMPGEAAPWVEEVKHSLAILMNTCDILELPFLDYVAKLTQKPVWGVGPLLPEQYWQSTDSIVAEQGLRPTNRQQSNYSDKEIMEWLDDKPHGSVLSVSFGSEVGPSMEEYPELAEALEESSRPFIWVIQRKQQDQMRSQDNYYFPDGLDNKVGNRGLIIHGWAPQLLIMSHQSIGGFVTHCGWNSTVEAMVRGVPLLAWPIRGDQYYNAKLVVDHLRIGVLVSEGYPADIVKKDDIVRSVERIFTDENIRKQSALLCNKFENGFPTSSSTSLNAFSDFVSNQAV